MDLIAAAEARLEAMRIDEAIRLFDDAEHAACDPDLCAGGRWVCHMLLGDFAAAWRESDGIAQRGKPDPNRFWDGAPVDGKRILIRCLHGLGDTLQFIRYVPLLRERAASVTVEAQPVLRLLLAEAKIADNVITWGEPEGAWDQQIEIIELPRIFRTTLETIPSDVPYLKIGGGSSKPQSNEAANRLRIGVVWASSGYNPARTIPLDLFRQLFRVPGITLFSLQADPDRQELMKSSGRVIDVHDPSACVLATAMQLKNLDLVITVDTMMAHLAGAMAVPVWTLLPFQCDWRWMLDRHDSPWYPTMRLFRQPTPGDWQDVLDRVAEELTRLTRRQQKQAGKVLARMR